MDQIIAIIYIFAISIVVLAFIDLKLSIAVYIAYLILVPYLQFKIAGFPLSYNLINTLLLAVLLYQSLIKKSFNLNFQAITPFLLLYFSLLFISLLTWGMPWNIQFNFWRASFMQSCILSLIIWNLARSDVMTLIYLKRAFIISMTIAAIYGLFLMQMKGLNPYTSFISDYFGIKDSAEKFSQIETRLDFSTAAKIQATMIHPMTWTLMLCFSIIIFSAMYLKTKNKILWILIGLIGFNILISGVRTGIAAIVIGFMYYLIRYRKFKLIFVTIIFLFLVISIINTNENMKNIFTSFIDIKGTKSNVNGSSITMRLDQLNGSIEEIIGHELAGKGYGWNGYYMSLHGYHPVILAFESLLFVVLCNSGYIGLLSWIFFFLLLYRLHRKLLYEKTDILLMDTFVITFAAYSIGTGDYGYMSFFAIFHSFLFSYLVNINKSKLIPTNLSDKIFD